MCSQYYSLMRPLSNTRVFYIRIEILLTDINYKYYLYTVFVCDYVYTTVYNLFCV